MNYFIKINESVFEISKTFAGLLEKDLIAVSQEIQDKKHIYILNDSALSSFQVVNSTSQTHFYIKIRNSAKLRVNKLFFEFLAPRSKQGLPDVEKTQNAKTTTSLSLDKFYTKPEVAESCVNAFSSNVKIKKQDLIVEPSAGDGSFIKTSKKFNCNKIFLDIAPENKQIIQANFLE